MFAIFLVGTGASVVIATLPIATTSRARADMQNKAVAFAQKELEAIRGLGYANATSTQLLAYGLIDSTTPLVTNTYPATNVDSASYDNIGRLLPSGTATVAVSQTDIDLRQVTVTVTWNDRGTTRTFSLGTLIANL
ncbi:MAG TPA: hypothetical protein VG820_11535, partial [Fimbriimonadaceae bacterium]|nr:hypothetical protein [Fimbriimonadaceae bacterium]